VTCAKTAERIELIFALGTGMVTRHIVFDWGPDPPKTGGVMGKVQGNLGLSFFSRAALPGSCETTPPTETVLVSFYRSRRVISLGAFAVW
jgi:hypothetical protein